MCSIVLARRSRKRGALPLVELMVVVAIIGILVAIAVPVYNNVVEIAAKNAHKANIRIIQNAVRTYEMVTGEKPTKVDDLVPDYIETWPEFPSEEIKGENEGNDDIYLKGGGLLDNPLTE